MQANPHKLISGMWSSSGSSSFGGFHVVAGFNTVWSANGLLSNGRYGKRIGNLPVVLFALQTWHVSKPSCKVLRVIQQAPPLLYPALEANRHHEPGRSEEAVTVFPHRPLWLRPPETR